MKYGIKFKGIRYGEVTAKLIKIKGERSIPAIPTLNTGTLFLIGARIFSKYKDRIAGSFGDMSIMSFQKMKDLKQYSYAKKNVKNYTEDSSLLMN